MRYEIYKNSNSMAIPVRSRWKICESLNTVGMDEVICGVLDGSVTSVGNCVCDIRLGSCAAGWKHGAGIAGSLCFGVPRAIGPVGAKRSGEGAGRRIPRAIGSFVKNVGENERQPKLRVVIY